MYQPTELFAKAYQAQLLREACAEAAPQYTKSAGKTLLVHLFSRFTSKEEKATTRLHVFGAQNVVTPVQAINHPNG
jgi:hypothetical protein